MDHLSIGEFSRESGLTAKALRLYDELGLLPPADVDPFSGYRRYTRDQLQRARLVARLRLVGMPLARIRLVLELAAPMAAAELAAYWRQVQTETAARGELVQVLLTELHQEETTMHADRDLTLTAAVRHGQGARDAQQDTVHAGRSLFAVADGFGNDAVSARVVAAVAGLDQVTACGDADAAMSDAVAAAARTTAGEEGGSTLTALWLYDDRLRVAHVGDCRLWRARDGRVDQLTRDHTLVAGLIEEGRLTEDEARSHPHRSLLNRAFAEGEGEADLAEAEVRPGDRFVLTSDGVHSVVTTEWLHEAFTGAATPDRLAAEVAAAVEEAGAPDNYGVVVIDVSSA